MFYRTSCPSWSSGPLPCFLSLQFTIIQSRATGIADHILPLGDLLFICTATANGGLGWRWGRVSREGGGTGNVELWVVVVVVWARRLGGGGGGGGGGGDAAGKSLTHFVAQKFCVEGISRKASYWKTRNEAKKKRREMFRWKPQVHSGDGGGIRRREKKKRKTSDAGSQYRCGRVGSGIQPHVPHTHTQ